MEYLAILIAVFLISIILKLRYKIQLFKSMKEGLLVIVSLLVIGSLWNSYAILRGCWSFKEEFFIGLEIGVMPLEEYLFILIIPFRVLVIYGIVTRKSYRQLLLYIIFIVPNMERQRPVHLKASIDNLYRLNSRTR